MAASDTLLTLAGTAQSALRAPAKTQDPVAARTAAEEFEAVFLGQILDGMFAGLETGGAFGGGYAESVYRGMLNQEYAKTIARQGGVRVADAVMRELLSSQERR